MIGVSMCAPPSSYLAGMPYNLLRLCREMYIIMSKETRGLTHYTASLFKTILCQFEKVKQIIDCFVCLNTVVEMHFIHSFNSYWYSKAN